MEYAICFVPNNPLRVDHDECSEMLTELLFGEACTVTESWGNWSKIINKAEGYVGWVTTKMLTEVSKEYFDAYEPAEQRVLTTLFSQAVNETTGEKMLLTGGSLLPEYQEDGTFRVKNDRFRINPADAQPLTESLLDTALRFLNTPYLWGGKNAMGMDCSGLTQVVMRMHGIHILRNASHQVTQGELVSFLSDAQPGDLAFFDHADGKISHVGMVAEKGYIIHCSGSVHIDKLDDQGIYSKELNKYTHDLRLIKRYK